MTEQVEPEHIELVTVAPVESKEVPIVQVGPLPVVVNSTLTAVSLLSQVLAKLSAKV